MAPDPETQPLLATSTNESTQGPTGLCKSSDAPKKADEVTWRTESRLVAGYSIPLFGAYLLQYFFNVAIVVVSSRFSTDELAGVSLGITTSTIVGYAVFEGMATALDTLCAQAYGAGNPQLVGLHAIRFTIFVHLVAVPIGLFWVVSPQVLIYLVPSLDLAKNAGTFLRWSLIGIPGYATFEAGKRFMQAQGDFTGGLLILLVCLPLNIFLNWLLVFQLGLRIPGAALAASFTNLVRPFLLLLYALFINRSVLQCWPERLNRKACFTNWRPMIQLSIPGVAMTLAEWTAFEILTFATSYVSTVALAAQTFLATAEIVVWHLPFSGSIVISTRIGQLVGGGYLDTSRKVSRYYLAIFVLFGLFNVLATLGLLEIVIHFLDLEADVRAEVVSTMSPTLIFAFFDSIVTGMHGIIRGLGWQSVGGWVTILCNYLYAVPLALVLELGPPGLGLSGLWIALASGLAIIAIVEGFVLRARSWDKVVEEARARQEG